MKTLLIINNIADIDKKLTHIDEFEEVKKIIIEGFNDGMLFIEARTYKHFDNWKKKEVTRCDINFIDYKSI